MARRLTDDLLIQRLLKIKGKDSRGGVPNKKNRMRGKGPRGGPGYSHQVPDHIKKKK